MLFNRFIAVRFKDAQMVIGGHQVLNGTHLSIPPTIEFDCSHTNESTANEASIKLYNMSAETQRKLFVEGKRVEVEAGYWPQDGQRDTGIIFKGVIRKVSTVTENDVDVVSTLTFGDGDDAVNVRRHKKKYPKGTKHATVVAGIAEDFKKDGITLGKIDIPDFQEPRPLTIERPAWRVLEDICHQHDRIWSVQDGVLNVYPADKPLVDKGIVLEPSTGLIGPPEFTDDGIEIKTLMVHYLRPGHTFILKSGSGSSRATEKYRIEEVSFAGSNVGGDFGATIKAKVMTGAGKVKRSRDRKKGRRP